MTIDNRKRGARRGFTLIELIVAIMILTVGVLGLAATASMVSRLIGGAGQQTIAANVAASRFERLRSLPCDSIRDRTATFGGIREHWAPVGGAVTAPYTPPYEVVDTVTYQPAGRKAVVSRVFRSYIRCQS